MSTAPVDGRTPCVIGVARRTWHPEREVAAPEPIEMWTAIARSAAHDASAPRDPLKRVDDLNIVHCQSWQYDDPAARLAERLELPPGRRTVSILAGTSPQRLLNAAAERMLQGDTRVALVVGGEALATKARLRRVGQTPAWSAAHPNPTASPLDLDEWFLPTELAHGVIPAWLTFALLDQARRIARQADLVAYRRELGQMLARCNAVAARNPHAWFRDERTADEIITPSPANRMIAQPYTKLMTAYMDVDMAAGVLLATHDEAESLGVPQERRVYLRGWGFARDATHVGARAELGRSAAMRAAATATLRSAGITIDDVALFDLYSCFTAALGFATDALGLNEDDPRPLTLTGALPYHGGPSSNYMSHSIGHVVERLREEPDEFALVSGVGMHMTKHVFACYSTRPGPVRAPDYEAIQEAADRQQPDCPVVASATGDAVILAATTVFDHDSAPSWLLAVSQLPDGRRAYARTTDPEVLASQADDAWIGRTVELRAGPNGTNTFHSPGGGSGCRGGLATSQGGDSGS